MRLPVLPTLFSMALFAAIAGCATPQYQTSIRLIPPADAPGQACVQDCETRKNACQTDCQARYRVCAKSIEAEVETRYAEALKQYELDLKQYAAALRHYELQLRFDWLNSHPFRHPYWWDPWPWPYFPPLIANR